MSDETQQPESTSNAASSQSSGNFVDKAKEFFTMGGDKKKWTKALIISALVLIFMGLAATAAGGVALSFLVRSIAEPSGAAPGSASGELTFPNGASTPENIKCLDDWIKNKRSDSPLNNKATTLLSAGQTYNVNPALVLGIAGVESTYGTNWHLNKVESKNYQNMKCTTGQRTTPGTECLGVWAKYPTWEKSIEEHSKYLRTYYLDNGKTTVEAIGSVYTESGSGEWAKTVSEVMGEIFGACPGLSSPATGAIINGNLIIIDPGHNSGGNSFSGTVDGTNNEGDNNWMMANKVKKNLETAGFSVLLTKNSAAENPSLSERVQFANSKAATLFVSLHSNAQGGIGPMGLVYCADADTTAPANASCATTASAKHGADVSKAILNNITSNLGLTNPRFRGARYGVLTNLDMPGTIIEMFAHDQSGDIAKVNGKADVLAKSISDGILQFVKKN